MTCPPPPPIWFSIFIFFLHGSTTVVSQNRLTIEVLRSNSDTPHSVGLPWTSDQSDAETSTWQHITITKDRHSCPPPPGWIRTRNPSKGAAAGPRVRPRGHRNRRLSSLILPNTNIINLKREEKIRTKCNNIDDLLSIPDVDYWLQSRHVSDIFMPIIRRKDHVLLHLGYICW